MKNQRDAVLGYANEQHAYFIRLIENDAVLGESYGIFVKIRKVKQPKVL